MHVSRGHPLLHLLGDGGVVRVQFGGLLTIHRKGFGKAFFGVPRAEQIVTAFTGCPPPDRRQ